MRCLIVGASMPMPTFELKYEDTWLYRFMKSFPQLEVIDKCRRASSVERLVKEGMMSKGYDLLELYNPDFVILHIGLTDASPRLLPRKALFTKIINRLPFSKFIYNLVRKTKGRTMSCADLSPDQFYVCLEKYVTRAAERGVIVFCIKIAHCGSKVLKVSPEMNMAIDIYNSKYDELAANFANVKVVDPLSPMADDELDSMLQTDGIHFMPKASNMCFENVKAAVIKEFGEIIANDKETYKETDSLV